ncbi:HEAT repeat domain-containing protein [Candidatus Palauibacter polyketidifaciens]|uniref:tetratricopeptide repeat protein n=1 Tax=Candidatus Palauibacter polyketidifaciens TaxID=3056740 RepID=UPI00239DDFFF|nr:HEAT repeat domain-containing protein [Candidatus Palauibacter polyketidifaciens]MDE2720247.1 HEAT repeat domain-containing protein [Candidatus Palauibacter polyketidifaciens]
MNNRVRHLTWTGLLLAGLTIVDAAPAGDALPVLGAGTLAAQTVQQGEVARFLEARRAINAEEFERAVALFQAVRTESALTTPPFEPDSYYWEAFARYRLGDLAEAQLLLEILMVGFPEARQAEPRLHREAGRLYHDARALQFEIRGQLASQGDAGDAERLLREAEETLDFATTPGFRVMPMEVGDRTLTLPVRVADLTAVPDSLAADSLADAQGEPDALGEPDAPDAQDAAEDYLQRLAESSERITDFERLVADYARTVPDYDARTVPDYDWQRAEYQEALRAASQERGTCDDVSVQLAALEAVMRYEINRMQVLRGVLARDDECSTRLHEEAVGLIAREETDDAEDVLLGIFETHSERSVRRHALQEMWRFNSWDVYQVLKRTLEHSDDYAMQSDAIEALRRSAFEGTTTGAAWMQYGLRNGAVNALLDAALDESKSESIRSAAIRAMGRRDDVHAAAFIPVYERLHADVLKGSVFWAVQRKVREEEDMETAAWARSVAFDTEESEDVREEAFTAWAGHPTVTVAYLADLYGEISEPFLKMQAIYAIFERADSDSDAPRVLMELIRNEPDQEVRERGIYWLGRTGSEEAVDFLLELLSPPAADTVIPPAADTVPRRPG